MQLVDILLLLLTILVIWQFMLFRQCTEAAFKHINDYCERNALQLVSIARSTQKLSRNRQGRLCWKIAYQFEFSSNGENKYQGELLMLGNKAQKFEVPPYASNFH